MEQTMPSWLKKRAFLSPNRIAIKTMKEEITFKELFIKAEEIGKKLGALGIEKGRHVGILAHNSLDFVIFLHALLGIGAKVVFLNTKLTEKELSFQLENSKAAILITDDELFKTSITGIQKASFSEVKKLEERNLSFQEEVSLSDVATIMYTSGTTGNPKGVVQTYGNHWWSATGSSLNLGLHDNDRWLLAVPLFHISGFSILIRSVIYGMTVILHEKFEAERVQHAIFHEGVTIISCVTAMLQKMLEHLHEPYPDTFRCLLLGGGPAPLPILEKCKEANIPVYQTYGMTETSSQIVTLSPEDALTKLGSAGKVLFPAQLKIKSENPQEAGEIVVKGPNVTKGYLYNEEATNKAIIDGWLHTGDMGYVDEDGYLYVLDRRSDLIISGGENVYPAEIESVLLSHPAVKEAGVTGQDDERWGKVPAAFLVVAHSIEESELKSFCQKRLASFKIPANFYFVDELTRNASNKLVRRKLFSLLEGQQNED
ncbi:o-succinylbenzoate--CoA ligase [Bacillus sp. JZ8]